MKGKKRKAQIFNYYVASIRQSTYSLNKIESKKILVIIVRTKRHKT